MMPLVYIALGSNIGDRDHLLATARAELAAMPQSRLVGVSAVEETEPIGPEQPRYLNQMALVDTELEPESLLDELQAIELRHGRERDVRWGPRTLDLDIVAYADGRRVSTDRLVVPHPELVNRDFWQREMASVQGGLDEQR